MMIDVTILMRVRSEGKLYILKPGHPIDFPVLQASKLIIKARGRVRPIGIVPGELIVWNSPLFGELRGEVLCLRDDAHVDVYHPLTNELARIPLSWLQDRNGPNIETHPVDHS
jgi:hypothetical protein